MSDKRLMRLLTSGHRLAFTALALFGVAACFANLYLGIAGIVLAGVLFTYYRRDTLRRRRELMRYMDALQLRFDASSGQAAAELPFPMAVVQSQTGEITWCNQRFGDLVHWRERFLSMRIADVARGFDEKWLASGEDEYPVSVVLGDRHFRITAKPVRAENASAAASPLTILFFLDVTELESLRRDMPLSRPVCAILQLDNYDELVKNASGTERAFLLANIDAAISVWAKSPLGILIRSERDKYVYVFEERHLSEFTENKFSVLESVRRIKSAEGIPATLSIGIGRDGDVYADSMEAARLALEMALSRGGDQVVIKNRETFEFFGGHSGETEKRTRVRSRVMAGAIGQMLGASSQVLIMGHKYSDMDSIGAATGVMCICRKLNIPAKIVLDLDGTSARVLYDHLTAFAEYKDAFATPAEAAETAGAHTTLVVVDTNRPDYIESPEVLKKAGRVIVIDHHRRAADYIENASLNLHEPYASSACELVAEVLQYLVAPSDIMRVEAECIMAGITLDTKNFTMKTGVRTFEAAAFLRRCGADTIEVKRLFQNDMDSYFTRCDIIRTAIKYHENIAIAHSTANVDRPVAAQAADELLSIAGIQASFVIYRNQNTTHISARSLGQINVQVVLEQLGGGGSLTNAGAQLGDKHVPEAADELRRAIDYYYTMT